MTRGLAILVSVAVVLLVASPARVSTAAAQATPAAATSAEPQPTGIVVSVIGVPYHVPGSDGLEHVEYDLLVTNATASPVTLTAIEAITPDDHSLLRLEGDALAAATQEITGMGPVAEIAPSGTVAVLMDVAVPAAEVPQQLTHRIAYELPADAPQASQIGSFEIAGPEVAIDPRSPVVLAAPLHGPGWLNVNSCCDPSSVHRSVRVAVDGERVVLPETFAIDWVRVEGELPYEGDGAQNEQWFGYGAEITSATAGTVVHVRDGQQEETPNTPTRFVDEVAAVGGNQVIVEAEPGVYAFYAHLQPGSVAVAVGDIVAVGDPIGLLGNSGNSTAPHLHFGLLDAPYPLAAESLPMVFDQYTLTGAMTDESTPVTSERSEQTETLPLNLTITEFR